jgi:hypothetical protein
VAARRTSPIRTNSLMLRIFLGRSATKSDSQVETRPRSCASTIDDELIELCLFRTPTVRRHIAQKRTADDVPARDSDAVDDCDGVVTRRNGDD